MHRRPRRRHVKGSEPIQSPEPVAASREARVRLDDEDRALIVAGLSQLLPESVRKNPDAWYKLRDGTQAKLAPLRALIRRLRNPQRGHPSSW